MSRNHSLAGSLRLTSSLKLLAKRDEITSFVESTVVSIATLRHELGVVMFSCT